MTAGESQELGETPTFADFYLDKTGSPHWHRDDVGKGPSQSEAKRAAAFQSELHPGKAPTEKKAKQPSKTAGKEAAAAKVRTKVMATIKVDFQKTAPKKAKAHRKTVHKRPVKKIATMAKVQKVKEAYHKREVRILGPKLARIRDRALVAQKKQKTASPLTAAVRKAAAEKTIIDGARRVAAANARKAARHREEVQLLGPALAHKRDVALANMAQAKAAKAKRAKQQIKTAKKKPDVSYRKAYANTLSLLTFPQALKQRKLWADVLAERAKKDKVAPLGSEKKKVGSDEPFLVATPAITDAMRREEVKKVAKRMTPSYPHVMNNVERHAERKEKAKAKREAHKLVYSKMVAQISHNQKSYISLRNLIQRRINKIRPMAGSPAYEKKWGKKKMWAPPALRL